MKFTVITINLNNAIGLQTTINSIVNQTFHDFEYIVIDGGSNDNSTKIIEQHTDKINYWVSEPDKGVYHAMNKAIKKANGEYLLFINSGDYLCNKNVLESCNNIIDNYFDYYSGNLILFDKEKQTHLKAVKNVSLFYCINEGLTHPNTFIRRNLFNKYGYYNEENRIVSDWEFFLITIGLNNASYKSIDVDIACFNLDGISSQPDNKLLKQETKNAIEKHVPKSILADMNRLKYIEEKMKSKGFKELLFIEKSKTINIIAVFMLKLFYFLFFKLKRVFN